MSLVISPVRSLSALNGVANGNVPSQLLESVGPSGQLLAPAARAFRALQFRCLGIGLPLTYTFGGTYRDFASQLRLFLSRYEPVSPATYYSTHSSRRKRWHEAGSHGYSSTYWVKKRINGSWPATAASPGTSNHGLAIAIDTAFDSDPSDGIGPDDAAYIAGHPQFEQFKRFVAECGFSFELQSEPWHIRYVFGDGVPQAVLDVEEFIANPEGDDEMTKGQYDRLDAKIEAIARQVRTNDVRMDWLANTAARELLRLAKVNDVRVDAAANKRLPAMSGQLDEIAAAIAEMRDTGAVKP